MTGRIRQRGENTWQIYLDFGRDVNGKRITKGFTYKGGVRGARARLKELLEEYKDGPEPTPDLQTLAEYLAYWLVNGAGLNVSPRTLQGYEDIIRVHLVPKLGAIPLAKLAPIQIQEYERKQMESGRFDGKGGLSPQTVTHHHRLLSAALKQAVAWRLLDRSPMDGVKPPRVEREDQPILRGDKVPSLLKLAEGTRLYTPLILGLTTGIRRGELLALTWSAVRFVNRRIDIKQSLEETRAGLRFKPPKTKKSRRALTMGILAAEALRLHYEEQVAEKHALGNAYVDQDLVFPGPTGEPWQPKNFSKAYSSLRARAGLDVTFHGLRHTHCADMLSRGIRLEVMSKRLGHSTIRTTADLYGHISQLLDMEVGDETDRALGESLGLRMEVNEGE